MANFSPVSAAIGGTLIGLAATLLMLLTGRVAGISGIFAGCLDFGATDKSWRVAFVVGLVLAPLVGGLVGYPIPSPEITWRERPILAPHSIWPTRTDIDRPLVVGAMLFGVGWGLVGLCPGPALENLATLSPRVIAFVVGMALGMVLHDLWWRRSDTAEPREETGAVTADG